MNFSTPPPRQQQTQQMQKGQQGGSNGTVLVHVLNPSFTGPKQETPPSPANLNRGRSAVSIARDISSPTTTTDSEPENGRTSPTISLQRGASLDQFCDYDTNGSVLYSLLETSHWEMCVTRCRTHPQEVRTWVVRRDIKTKGVRWKLLPIHAAVIFQAPTYVITALVEKYPEGIARVDDQGMLPLHLAFRHKKADDVLLQLLLIRHPEGVLVPDRRGRTPLELARDGFFSAKLVQYYAKAFADASPSPQTTTQEQRAYKALDQSEAQGQNDTLSKAHYDSQIARLSKHYDQRIAALEQNHKINLQDLQNDFKQKEQMLKQHHQEEINAIRDVATSSNQLEVNHGLATQIQELNAELTRYSGGVRFNKVFNREMKEHLSSIASEHQKLKTLVERQQEELEAAQAMRVQLLKTLLKQEDEDAPHLSTSCNEIQEVVQVIQFRIDHILTRVSAPNANRSNESSRGDADKYEEYVQANRIADEEISAITESSIF